MAIGSNSIAHSRSLRAALAYFMADKLLAMPAYVDLTIPDRPGGSGEQTAKLGGNEHKQQYCRPCNNTEDRA